MFDLELEGGGWGAFGLWVGRIGEMLVGLWGVMSSVRCRGGGTAQRRPITFVPLFDFLRA